MPTGIVKFFNAAKGFGFITPDDGGKEVFVPAASAASAGVPNLKAGQRLSFEVKPDGKGPKAVNLTLLANPAPPEVVNGRSQPLPEDTGKMQLTVYHDPAFDVLPDVLAEFRAAGYEPRIVDYIAAPPTRDELKRLSMLLRGSDQSLVRKYDPLFRELNLDDRFISENDFWDAVVEHPSLINGPLVATATKADVCRSRHDVKVFLGIMPANGVRNAPKKKAITDRILKLLAGGVAASPAAIEYPANNAETQPAKPDPGKAKIVIVKKAAAVPEPAAKTEVVKKATISKPATAKTAGARKPKTAATKVTKATTKKTTGKTTAKKTKKAPPKTVGRTGRTGRK